MPKSNPQSSTPKPTPPLTLPSLIMAAHPANCSMPKPCSYPFFLSPLLQDLKSRPAVNPVGRNVKISLEFDHLSPPLQPGKLQSMGSHRVGHNWSDLAAAAAGYRWYLKLSVCMISQGSYCSYRMTSSSTNDCALVPAGLWVECRLLILLLSPQLTSSVLFNLSDDSCQESHESYMASHALYLPWLYDSKNSEKCLSYTYVLLSSIQVILFFKRETTIFNKNKKNLMLFLCFVSSI